MNRYRARHAPFTICVASKVSFALLVAVALAASNFQGTTLAADSSQTSPTLHEACAGERPTDLVH